MCDRAACAAARLEVVRRVNVEGLRILKDLLQAVLWHAHLDLKPSYFGN